MSGYELKKVIDASVNHFWSADQSQIYRTLAALVDQDLVSRTTVMQDDRPNLHIHDITSKGLEALDAWLDSPPDAEVIREPFLARLFFAGRLPVSRIVAVVEARRAEISQQLASLENTKVPEGPQNLADALRFATFDNGIVHARTELAWIDSVLTLLKEHQS